MFFVFEIEKCFDENVRLFRVKPKGVAQFDVKWFNQSKEMVTRFSFSYDSCEFKFNRIISQFSL